MSDLDDFLKAVSEAKQKDPISEKVKQVKTNIKEDLGDLFSQISVIKEQDPVQQKNKKIEKQVQESVKMDLGTLFSQLSSLKNDLEEELVVAEAKLVEVKSEDILTEVSPIPALPKIRTPEQRIKDTNADVDKYLTGKSFQQPDPDLVSKDVEAIRTKIKFLEQAIGRIAAAGPGGGEVNLRYLDDVDRSTIANNRFLTYDEASKKFKFIAIAQEDGVQSDWNQANNEARDFIKNKPTIPSAQIQSDWTQTNNTSLDFIKNKPTIPDVSGIQDAISASGEPMGHEDKTQSVISFNAATRTFTIAPVAGSFEVWVRGTKQIYTTAQTVTIPNTSGIYYIYFDSNGIGAQTNYFIWDTQAPTSLVYYNAVTGLAPYFADERHGTTLDWQTHEYLHRTRGAVIANGFSIGSYTVGGAVQIDIGNGTFFDEDLQIDVVHSNTPTANTWEQDLQGPAQIPMFYLSGTGWVRDNPTGYVNKAGTSRPRYNLLSGGTWSVADIDANKFGTTFIVATNNLTYPIIGIMSQSSHANQGDAEGLEFSDLILTGFPVAEFRLLYKVVFKATSLHGILTSVWDLRQLSATTPSAAIGSDHGLLSGLGDDDHPQYLLRTDAAIAAITSGTINGATIGATTPSTGSFTSLTASADATINGITIGKGIGSVNQDNVKIGNNVLTNNTTGEGILAVGSNSMAANTTGKWIAAFGGSALGKNTTGIINCAFGSSSLGENTIGSNNIGFGDSALRSNVGGGNNVGIGFDAGRFISTGSGLSNINQSIFIGNSTKSLANSETNTIVIGYNAVGLGSNTTVIGNSSTTKTKLFGTLEATGDATINTVRVGLGAGAISTNTAVGATALNANTTGARNASIGFNTLFRNTTGSDCLAIGSEALYNNTTGNENIGIGRYANVTNEIGIRNIAIGVYALRNNTASNNVGIGFDALNANTGENNVAIGNFAISGATSGGNNVGIGYNTQLLATTNTNSIVIGYNAVGLGSNTTVIGNSSTTQTKLFGTLEATGDATINGIKIGRGNGNQPTNLAVGVSALSASLMSTATTQNVGIGNSTLSNIASTVTQIDVYSYNNTALVARENVNNIQLTYDTGTPVESGGTYPIINLQIYDDDGYYLGAWQIVDGGSKFVNTTTRFRCQITTAFGNQLDFTFYIVSISTGSGNTAIGYLAGSLASVGTDCVYIGRNANPSTGLPPRTNEIVIGANAVGAGNNTARIGDSSTTLYVGNLITNSIYAANQLFETSTSANFNLYGTSTGASTISLSQTSGTLTIGGTSSSTSAGTITLGRATGTSTVNIGTGVPATSRTKTINIGTSATTPTGTTLINIGANALTTTTIRGPAVTLAPLGTASAGATRFSSPYLNLQLSKFIGGVTYTSGLRISSSCDSSGTEMYLFDSNYGEVTSPDRGSLVRFNFPNTYLQVMNRNDSMGIQYGATYGTGYMGLVSVGASMPSGANTSRYLYGMHAASFAQGSIIPATSGNPNFRNILDNGSGNLICGSLNTGLGGTSTITATNFLQINHTTPSTSTTTGALQVAGGAGIAGNLNVGGKLTVTTTGVPTAYNSAGTTGTITWDADYIYVCVATNIWKRSAITTW